MTDTPPVGISRFGAWLESEEFAQVAYAYRKGSDPRRACGLRGVLKHAILSEGLAVLADHAGWQPEPIRQHLHCSQCGYVYLGWTSPPTICPNDGLALKALPEPPA